MYPMSSTSPDTFLRARKEKQETITSCLRNMITAFSGEDRESKLNSCHRVLEAGAALKALIAAEDIPPWLKTVEALSHRYVTHPVIESATAIILVVPGLIDSSIAHKWEDASDKAFDFDAVVEQFRKESKLPELFDKVIVILQEIIDSGDIDSIKALDAIKAIHSALLTNRNSSFPSMQTAWTVFRTFCENFLWATLKELPIAGPFIDALKATIDEFDKEITNVQTQINTKVTNIAIKNIPITYSSNGRLIEYGQTGVLSIVL